jgi:hypothetical protein
MSPMREKDRKLRRRQKRQRKIRKLKQKLLAAKDLREAQEITAKIRKYQPFFDADEPGP